MTVGIFPGKFLPPHRGHLNAIIRASTQVDKLYVVVSDNKGMTLEFCRRNNIRLMSLNMRSVWLAQELSGFDHVEVVKVDESTIPFYPDGAKEWAELVRKAIPEKFDVIFGGEPEYEKIYMDCFPGIDYKIYDPSRQEWNISATKIRKNFLENWEYILGAARPHFAKRVLITGTESCGKTTLTKYLAKIFHTSWSEEYGRYYADERLGGNESLYTAKDFENIAQKQKEQDEHALRTANKIAFFDTDPVVTLFYLDMYLPEEKKFMSHNYSAENIKRQVDPNFYDAVLLMTPSVKWVADGKRFNSENENRWKLHNKLKKMYADFGFSNVIEIDSSSYFERLERSLEICKNILK